MKIIACVVIVLITFYHGIAMEWNFSHGHAWAGAGNAATIILVAILAKICGNLLTIAGF